MRFWNMMGLGLLMISVTSTWSAEKLFFEAESMSVDGKNWQVREHFEGWYTGVPSGVKMLWGANGGQGEAKKTLEIKKSGIYKVWVRYLDTFYRGPFRTKVFQNGNSVGMKDFDVESLRKTDEGKRKWGDGYGRFVWDSFTVDLSAGQAEVVLTKVEPFVVSWIARYPDCFLLTDDLKYEPVVNDFIEPLYVRVRMGINHRDPCAIHVWGRRPRDPWFLPHCNIYQTGMVEACYTGYKPGGENKGFLTANTESPWINLVPLLDTMGDNRVQFTAMQEYFNALPSSEFSLDLSTTPSKDGIFKTFSRSGPGGGLLLLVDLTKREKIKSDLECSQEALQEAQKLTSPQGRRPKLFPVITGCAIDSAFYQQVTVENEIKILSTLGFSSISGYDPTFFKQGFTHVIGGSGYFHLAKKGCLSDPDLSAIRPLLERSAKDTISKSLTKNMIAWSLMDEPGSVSMDHIIGCEVCIRAFREYLKKQGDQPENFDRKNWDEVFPFKDGKKEPKLFYQTVRFRCQVLSDFFKLGTDVLKESIPDVKTTANFAEDLTYFGNALSYGCDWFLIHAQEGLRFGWTEEWLPYCTTLQLCGYRADFLRAACNSQNQGFASYNIYRLPWDMHAKAMSEIGHGAQAIFFYNYGPYYAPSCDQCSTVFSTYPGLQKMNYSIGKVEDYLLNTKVQPSRIALLYSHTTDIWTINDGISTFGKERMYLYVLLRHLGYPVDIITESDLITKKLQNYQVIFCTGSHLRRDTVEALVTWVRKGGLMWISAGSLMSDELNQPLAMDQEISMTRQPYVFRTNPGRELYEMPGLKAEDTVQFKDWKLDALCGFQKVKDSGQSRVLATFADGSPAVMTGEYGKGRIIFCGFFPGLAYSKSGMMKKKERDEQWEKKHLELVTYNPPDYDEGYRQLMSKVLENISYKPPVETNNYLVETNVLEGKKGMVITLSNWSGQLLRDLKISIRLNRRIGKPFTSISPIKSVERKEGKTILTLDLGAGDFVVLPNT